MGKEDPVEFDSKLLLWRRIGRRCKPRVKYSYEDHSSAYSVGLSDCWFNQTKLGSSTTNKLFDPKWLSDCWFNQTKLDNPTLGEFCFAMIGRADIEGSKSDVAMNDPVSNPGWLSDSISNKKNECHGSYKHIILWKVQ